MSTLFPTLAIAFGMFVIMAVFLSLKVLFKIRTPLKAHACEVMCQHGKPQVCVCASNPDDHCHDETSP